MYKGCRNTFASGHGVAPTPVCADEIGGAYQGVVLITTECKILIVEEHTPSKYVKIPVVRGKYLIAIFCGQEKR